MLFNSFEFLLVFLPIVTVAYFALARVGDGSMAQPWLLVASLFFYAWWKPAYLPLILGSIGFNFGLGAAILGTEGAKRRGMLLAIGVGGNLLLLGYFKYAAFAVDNASRLFDLDLATPEIALPIAISFFTFQQIAYLVDCHRKEAGDSSLSHYALFVTFFPQLIAGPIVHHREMMGQFRLGKNRRPDPDNINLGLFLLSIGLFKKVVIADGFARWATRGFDELLQPSAIEAWISSLSYTFQLYFDFSGYADMALGAALLFNIRLPFNFLSPYRSTNIGDFWRRWHITLGRFLRDYLYVPLGGNQRGLRRQVAAIAVTFLLGGLWHGASWMFVIWGALHGLAVVTHRVWARIGGRLPKPAGWALTFLFVNFAWVFFRAHDLESAFKILRGMAGLNGMGWSGSVTEATARIIDSPFSIGLVGLEIGATPSLLIWFTVAFGMVLGARNSNEIVFGHDSAARTGYLRAILYGMMAAIALAVVGSSSYTEFIYFNF